MEEKFFISRNKDNLAKFKKQDLDSTKWVSASGIIKWFDINKNYGFITLKDSIYAGKDVLLYSFILRRDGFLSIPIGSYVECFVYDTERGLQCAKIEKIDISTSLHPLEIYNRSHNSAPVESDLVKATLKWFNYEKGFGFFKVENLDEDVFLHIEVLRRFGIIEILPDQEFLIRYGPGKKGKTAVEIYTNETVRNFFKH